MQENKTYAQGLLEGKKFQYGVVAYNNKKEGVQGQPLFVDSADLEVTAKSEEAALAQARELISRKFYVVFRVQEVPS